MGTMLMSGLTLAERSNAERLEAALERLEPILRADAQYRDWVPRVDLLESLQDERLAAIEVLGAACAAHAGRPALGEWVRVPDGAGAPRFLPEFRTISYAELWQRTVALATGLVRGAPGLRPGEIAGILGYGSIDYVVADMACLHAGVASALLPMSLNAEELRHLVNEGELGCLVCSGASLAGLREFLPGCPTVRSVVLMEQPGAAALESLRAWAGRPVFSLDEVAAQGQAAVTLDPWLPARGSDPLATLMYTSGSTGLPKGALLTQRIWRSHWSLRSLLQFTRFPNIGLSFYPLSHALGRNTVVRTLLLGGLTQFTLDGDLATLFEDVRLVRPTFLNLVPRISEVIHQAHRGWQGQDQGQGQAGNGFLGDRLTAVVIGSAPTAPDIAHWLAERFEVPVYEGYGSTEAGVLTVDGVIVRATVSDYRLVGVPELGYRLEDHPFPRGELRVRSRQGIPGFFRNEAATRALYDADGFLRTGDIVEQRGPDQVAWVDRKNNVVKLAQGEYVTLWRLESEYSGASALLDQVYLYANSRRAYLLAVVVPDGPGVRERLGQAPAPEAVKRLLRLEFQRIAGAAGLHPFEVPRDFLVETERWSRDNGCLTGIDKPARPQLKQRYGARLEALYQQIEAVQAAGPVQGEPPRSLAGQVGQAVAAVLGQAEVDLGAGSFRDLGGDSVSAMELALRLEELGTAVPVSALLNPGPSMLALVRELEARGPDPDALPTFAAVHGRGGPIRAADLELERLFGPADLAEAARVAAQPLAPVRTVLLTGANGFLGRILCLAWLERLANSGGQLIAIVRAADDRAAAGRLRSVYRSDPVLLQRFDDLAEGRLKVLAGDLAAPRLGLAQAVHAGLAGELDLIVHPGAIVNHVFTYKQLFEPNVLGTAQLIRLALQVRRKRMDFISSVGVLGGAVGSGRVLERDGVDALQAVWPAQGGYAHGYATSKWAGEVLMREAHERFRLPGRVFRPGLILPHRRYRGQANGPDLLSRLLVSVIRTGLAPASFYGDGEGARGHCDGLPVDFIATALVHLSSAGGEGLATYQVSGDPWAPGDGAGQTGERRERADSPFRTVSLDTLMDWVASAGYPIHRIADHTAWFAAFQERLRQLPAEQQQHSALPILQQWAAPLQAREGPRADTSLFRQALARLAPPAEAEPPELNEPFIHKYLEDLRVVLGGQWFGKDAT